MGILSDGLSAIAPWLVTALTSGPVGVAGLAATKLAGALGLTDSSIDSVKTALDSTSGVTAAEWSAIVAAENEFKLAAQKLGYEHEEALCAQDIEQLKLVNETIRTELVNSATEAWYQKSWRPACGYAVAIGSLLGVVFSGILAFMAVFGNKPEALQVIPALASAFALILGVPGAAVGIAAWHRGMMQRNAAGGK